MAAAAGLAASALTPRPSHPPPAPAGRSPPLPCVSCLTNLCGPRALPPPQGALQLDARADAGRRAGPRLVRGGGHRRHRCTLLPAAADDPPAPPGLSTASKRLKAAVVMLALVPCPHAALMCPQTPPARAWPLRCFSTPSACSPTTRWAVGSTGECGNGERGEWWCICSLSRGPTVARPQVPSICVRLLCGRSCVFPSTAPPTKNHPPILLHTQPPQVSYTSWFLDAFNYAMATGMHVVNLSIGGRAAWGEGVGQLEGEIPRE